MDDSKIIELYMERSEQAISETSKKYGRYCHYIAYSILHNDEDSEECVNDTYLRAWNSIPPKRPSKLQTFLGKITRNLSLNKWEKLSAEKRGAGQTSLILDELSECIPAEQDAVNTVENMVIRDVLDRFLDELPAETRKIFVRRYFYMSPVKEIADEYGLSESKVTVTLFRTRGKLKSVFIVLPLEKPCNIRRFRLSNPQTVCTFPCFFPYGLKQGKDFYSPLTTLSSSRAELRFASLVEWA